MTMVAERGNTPTRTHGEMPLKPDLPFPGSSLERDPADDLLQYR